MRFLRLSPIPLLAFLALVLLAGCEGVREQRTPPGVFEYEAWFVAVAPDGTLCELNFEGLPYQSLRTSEYRVLDRAISPDHRFYLMEYGYLGYGTDTEIFAADLETGAIRQLTDNRVIDTRPHWTPDGEWITYIYIGDHLTLDENAGLYRVRRDGSDRELIVAGRIGAYDWSPDGQTLVYSEGDNIWRVAAPAVDERTLLAQGLRGLRWSPDGTMIATVEDIESDDVINEKISILGSLSIYLIDNSEARTVLPLPSHIQYFNWSPDSEWIIFHGDLIGTDSDRHYDTYKIRPDGTGLEPLAECGV